MPFRTPMLAWSSWLRHLLYTQRVPGSIPGVSTFFGGAGVRLRPRFGLMPGVKVVIQRASIAQMVERKTLNLVVVGSIPTGGAFCTFVLGARHPGGSGDPWQASNKPL